MIKRSKKLYLLGVVLILAGMSLFAGGKPEVEKEGAADRGPQTAKKLTIAIYNKAANVTTYSVGNSWNDWLLWLVYDKLREPIALI